MNALLCSVVSAFGGSRRVGAQCTVPFNTRAPRFSGLMYGRFANRPGPSEQSAISFKLSAHNGAAQEMLFATLEFGRELCTCSPDVMGQ